MGYKEQMLIDFKKMLIMSGMKGNERLCFIRVMKDNLATLPSEKEIAIQKVIEFANERGLTLRNLVDGTATILDEFYRYLKGNNDG